MLSFVEARAPLIIILYFAAQAAIRVLTPGGLGLDEAEILLTTQKLEWGYGPQPPLYTYLQSLSFAIFGETKLGLVAVKYPLLAATALGFFIAARECGASRRIAAMAGFSIMLVPQFSWESQRALTHSVLAVAIGAWCLVFFLRARRTASLRDSAALGVLIGAGLLSKFNFAFFAAGLLVVSLLRPRAPRWHAGVSIILAAGLLAPFLIWMQANPAMVTDRIDKFAIDAGGPIQATFQGIAAIGQAAIGYFGLLIGVLALLFWLQKNDSWTVADVGPTDSIDRARVDDLRLVLTISGIAVAIAVIASGTTMVKDRWLHPVLFAAPLFLVLHFADRITTKTFALLSGLIAVIAGGAMLAMPINKIAPVPSVPRHAAPIPPLAERIAATGNHLLVNTTWLAGNLRLARKEFVALTPQMPGMALPLDGTIQLLWEGRQGATPPQSLIALYERRFGGKPALTEPERLSASYGWPNKGTFSIMRAVVRQ